MLNGVVLVVFALCALSCGTPGVVEVQRVEGAGSGGSTEPKPEKPEMTGACPSGWSCRDLSAIGEATDGDGQAITASCSKGGIMPCDEADPASSCTELPDAICVHLNVGGQAIVSCGQRCTL